MQGTNPLTQLLRQARGTLRLSQLELALRIRASQRHVSYVESGRAMPSRPLLMHWLRELQLPLRTRNHALMQAGYAPAYSEAPLTDASLRSIHEALGHLAQSHDPLPCYVLDAQWNIVHLNRGGAWLAATLLPEWTASQAAGQQAAGPMNMLDLMLAPQGLLEKITNLAEVGPQLVAQLQQELAGQGLPAPCLTAKLAAIEASVARRLGSASKAALHTQPAAPVMTTRFATAHGELAFFSMFSTFGTPQSISVASLRIEHLFAADEATRAVLQAQVPSQTAER
jgi:transcriptional regulator with XRE-family HTH domain